MPERAPSAIRLHEIACPLCSSDQWRLHVRAADYRYRIPGVFQLVRCNQCRHVYLNPQPVAADLAACYPDNYGPHQYQAPAASAPTSASTQSAPTPPWYAGQRMKQVPGLRGAYYWLMREDAELVPPGSAPDRRALEIGCASGRFLERLRNEGWQVEGIEPSDAAAARARSRGLDVRTGTLDSIDLSPETFDAVFAWMVLEHVPDPRRALEVMHGALKTGGWLILSVPNAGCWEPWVFGRYWYAYDLPRHLHHFSPGRLRRLLQETGYVVERVVHQANLLNVVASCGIVAQELCSLRGARRLIDYPDAPGMWGQLILAPLAKLFTWTRQSGRITVLARKRN